MAAAVQQYADQVSPELQAKINANATEPMQPTGFSDSSSREEDASPRKGRRARSMATINAALLAQQEEQPRAEKNAQTGSVMTPHAAPPLDTDDPKHPELAQDSRLAPPPWKARTKGPECLSPLPRKLQITG